MGAFREQPAGALRAYAQQLADLHFAMELAVDVSPADRRVLTEQILARIGQVGHLIRHQGAGGAVQGTAKGAPTRAPAPPPADDLLTVAWQNSGLLVRLLGGLLIAYALGSLATLRRVQRPAPPARRRDSGVLSPAPGPGAKPTTEQAPISLAEIRGALAAGGTVMLQTGYEIAPSQRDRFLTLVREIQGILRHVGGQTYTVWEDQVHQNRFYELLVCRDTRVLDHLATADGPLPRLVQQAEACRVPDGFAFRRVWRSAVPGQERRVPFVPGEAAPTPG
jgi:hypothetical protein